MSGILMILSPAKTLDLSPTDRLASRWTNPSCDADKTQQVSSALRHRKPKDLEKLLGISASLAKTAQEHWLGFQDDPSKRSDLKPCIFSFSGAAYQGLQANECTDEAIDYMQRNLRIIDPLYGVLRPLDVMQPYRLEMSTKMVFPKHDKTKLVDFWKPAVCSYLSNDLSNSRENLILLNLASDEYAAAVDAGLLPEGTQHVKVVFWEQGRTIAIHAKRARGLMVRYLAEAEVQDLEGVKRFDKEGYSLVAMKSDDTILVFDRTKQAAGKQSARNGDVQVKESGKQNPPKRMRRS